MSKVERLREFVSERLTAAAEEIFRVFEKTIVEYEEEIDRQRRLLDIVWKPHVKLHRAELPQQHVCKQEEVLSEQQLCNQERNSSLDREEQEGEQLVLKQETDEANSDQQLLSPSSAVAESQDQEGSKCVESDSTTHAQPNPKMRHQENTSHSNNTENSLLSESHCDTELPQQHVCKQEEVLSEQQLCNQERNSSLDRDDPEPPQVKEEQEELCTSQEGAQLVLKQETDAFMMIPIFEDNEPEANSDHHLLSHSSSMSAMHSNTHSGKKSLTCDTCGKAFKYRSHLNVHIRCHTGEKPYPCNTCGKRFSQLSKLCVHIKIHTGEKPYSCETCGKRFREMSKVKKHMRIHTGERPYPCVFCGNRFNTTTILKSHLTLHTGEKPFSCNTCGKKFKLKQSLHRHLSVHAV